MGRLTQRATLLAAVLFAVALLGLTSGVAAQAPWNPPAAGTRFYFSGDPEVPIRIDSGDATSVRLHWGKRALEAVGLFHLRTANFHQQTRVSRPLVAGIFPLETGKRVEWQLSQASNTWNFSLTVLRRETLPTKLGTLDTYVVELHQESTRYLNPYEGRTEFWYAPAYRFWVKYVYWHVKGVRPKDWEVSEEIVKVEAPDGAAVAQATPVPSPAEPSSKKAGTESTGRPSPRAAKPTYKLGDTWIRTDGSWKVLRVDRDGYLFSDGSGGEFRLSSTLGVSKVVVRGVVELEIATPNLEWPLEVGRFGSSLVEIVALPPAGSPTLRKTTTRHSWSVAAFEDVKTPAGTFQAYKILNRFLSEAGREHFSYTIWYASSVGRIVKAESRIAGLSFELAAVEQTPGLIATRPSEPTPGVEMAPPSSATRPPSSAPPPEASPAVAPRPVPNPPGAPSPPLPASAAVPTLPAGAPSPQVAAADTEPPRIALNYPPEGAKLGQEQLVVLGLVTDNVAVEQVLVSLNGKMVAMTPESTVSTKSRSIRTPVTLQPGENVIEVTAVDKAGNASQVVRTVTRVAPAVATPAPPTPVPTERWAVVIGIGTYENAGIPRLRYSVPDAEAIYQTLIGRAGLKKANVLLLTDRTERKPTLKNIKYALGTFLARAAKKDDTVLIFFAGHGAPEADPRGLERDGLAKYLIPSDADPDDLFSTALPMDDLQAIFGRIESERVVAFLDACYSGAAGGRTFASKRTRAGAVDDLFLERLTRSKGRAIVTAARPAEVSIELPDLGHGVFTYYLIEGLKGAADLNRDGIVTLQELYEYLEQQVTRKSRAVGAPQHPVMKGELEGVLPLTKVRAE